LPIYANQFIHHAVNLLTCAMSLFCRSVSAFSALTWDCNSVSLIS